MEGQKGTGGANLREGKRGGVKLRCLIKIKRDDGRCESCESFGEHR